MKKNIHLVFGLLFLLALHVNAKDYLPSFVITNGTHDSTTYCNLHYSIPSCSSLNMFAITYIGGQGDSTDWFLNGQLIYRTYYGDTFHATLQGSYTAKLYEPNGYTQGPNWACSGYDDMFFYESPSIVILTVKSTCSSPISGFAATNITSSKATLNWNALTCALAYKVRYRVEGTSSWTKKSVSGNTGFKKLKQLNTNTTYEWGVRTKCTTDPNVFSDFSPTQTFTTANLRSEEEQLKPNTEIAVYPNPSSETIFFDRPVLNEVAQLKIINCFGQIVMGEEMDANSSSTISISSLPAGNYFIIIQNSSGVLSGKFIKE